MTDSEHHRDRRLRVEPAQAAMIVLALFAFAWAIVRASVQAVTGDEAATYVFFVARHDPYQWFPAANNHVLNSLLMRGFVSVFGLSHLTVRAPALIGAFLYIAAAFWLSKLVSFRWSVRLPLFVCLVYNPFIFDFLVAARGYGMASAFLMWAIAFPAWCYLDPGAASPRRLILACSAASACLALSFAASFTFAFVNTLSLLALLVWALRAARIAGPEGQRRLRWRLVAAAILPGLALTVLLPSYTLLHWPKGQLFFGGTSLWETITSVIQASLYRLNPHLLNPLLYPVLAKTRNFLVPTIFGIAAVEACLLLFRRWRPDDGRSRRLATLGATVAGIAVFSLLIHWLSLRVFGLLLPGDRTAIYLAPLFTLAAGVLASITLPSRAGGIPRRALTVMLFVLGFYYVFCLRLTYFKEWQYQEDVKKVYDVVAWYNHNRGVREVEANWPYHASLLFYRDLSGRENLTSITSETLHPPGKQLYVLSAGDEEGFIKEHGLKAVYRGESTDVVVAVRPEFAVPARTPCYPVICP